MTGGPLDFDPDDDPVAASSRGATPSGGKEPLADPPGGPTSRGGDDSAAGGPLDVDAAPGPAPRRPVRSGGPPGASVPKMRPPWASRWGWLVGAAALLAIALITLNTFGGGDAGGATGLPPGTQIPPFAAPLALSDLEGDVNVAIKPGDKNAGARPACDVRGPKVLNSCELLERGPLVLGFLATRGGDCTPSFDDLQQVHERYPKLQVAAVAIRGNREDLRRTIREHGWTYPVGYDSDGVLAGLYGVAVCPTVAFVYPDGRVRGTVLGHEPAAELDGRVRRLLATSRAHGWTG